MDSNSCQYPLINCLANYQVEECEVDANDTALIGNGFCNDITNVRSCDFDGGDCCGENISTEFCDLCTCHLDELTTDWIPPPPTLPPTTTQGEFLPSNLLLSIKYIPYFRK
jgi:hypothetical protein